MTQSSGAWTVRRLLEWTTGFLKTKGVDSPRLSGELLLAYVLSLPRIRLYMEYERPLEPSELDKFRDLVKRAGNHEPIAYLTGIAHFFNLELAVDKRVLIPRPDTETLVENVLQFVRHATGFEAPRVLDLCTGSGCIALAIARQLKAANVLATDISPDALDVARANAEKLKLADRVVFVQGDLFEAMKNVVDPQPYHLIVSNPPYIPSAQVAGLDANVRDFEPALALDGGADGLDFHRRILAEGAGRLLPGGRMFLEIAFDQGESAIEVARQVEGLIEPRVLKDLAGNDRVLVVSKPAADSPAA